MWTPLQDKWDEYEAHLQSLTEEGLLDDPIDAQEVLYPSELNLGEGEKDDVREFITERLQELFEAYQAQGGLNPNLIGTYLFRAIVLGMAWEKERIGI